MSVTTTYRVFLAPTHEDAVPVYSEVTGSSVDTDNGELFIYRNGVIEAIFSRGTWTYVKVNA